MKLTHFLLGAALTLAAMPNSQALADAGLVGKGDVSVGLSMVYEPFNTFWYYTGPDTSLPYDGARYVEDASTLNFSNYSAENLLGTRINLFNTGLKFEFGLSDQIAIWGETQFVSGSNGSSSTSSIGDTRLGAKFDLTKYSPVTAAFSASAKIPGLYAIQQAYSPGDGQPDLEAKLSLGGLARKRRMFYDVGLGYRIRLPYAQPSTFEYDVVAPESCTPTSQSLCETYHVYFLLDGPSNETFVDATVGYFVSRKALLFMNINGVDSHSGAAWDDVQSAYDEGYEGHKLFTELEEDYLRTGVGVLVKPRPSMTAYFNYSYVVLGRNTAGFLRTESGLPVGTFAFGLEFTFGTGSPNPYSASLTSDEVLAMRFSQ